MPFVCLQFGIDQIPRSWVRISPSGNTLCIPRALLLDPTGLEEDFQGNTWCYWSSRHINWTHALNYRDVRVTVLLVSTCCALTHKQALSLRGLTGYSQVHWRRNVRRISYPLSIEGSGRTTTQCEQGAVGPIHLGTTLGVYAPSPIA